MTKAKSTKVIAAAVLAVMLVFSLFAVPVFAGEAPDPASTESSATIEFKKGELTLPSVPSLDFGSHDIPTVTSFYKPTNTLSPVTVSDLRGTGTGWHLTAQLSEFKNANDQPTLNGALLTVTDPSVTSGLVGNTSPAPANELDENNQFVLTSDNAVVKILSAEANAGMGVWDQQWTGAGTELTVFPGNVSSTNTSTLTWILQDTP